MEEREHQPISVVASIHRHVLLFHETVQPWQTISGLAWLLAGVFCCKGEVHLFADWSIVALVVAVTSARFSGMCWNRLIDWKIDAKNPRTSRRAVPSGRMSQHELAIYALLTLGLFLGACFFLPVSAGWMGIGVAMALLFYSFTKRFTAGCHFILGMIHACLPLAGSIWQCGSVSFPVVLLSIAAFAAVSGTDILYALQDELFDRRLGLHSIPSRFGTGRALEIAATVHTIASLSITFALVLADLSLVSYGIWGGCMGYLLSVWRSVWKNPSLCLAGAFPILLTGFSLISLITLVANKVWIALS